MYTALLSVVSVFAVLAGKAAAQLVIVTPTELVQCKPVQLNWTATTGPYDLIVASAAAPCDTVLADLGNNHTATTLNWLVDIPVGEKVVFSLVDGAGKEGWTGELTVKAGDSSCLSKNPDGPTPTATTSSTVTPILKPVQNAGAGPASPSASKGPGGVPVGAAKEGLLGSAATSSHSFSGLSVVFAVAAAVLAVASF